MGTKSAVLAYRLCPSCNRAVPLESEERFCTNCGHSMLTACPKCRVQIQSPYARFCGGCGEPFSVLLEQKRA